MSPLARPELIWSTENVAAKLREPAVRMVDCRFAFDRDMREEYRAGHIPGAVHVNWSTDLAAPRRRRDIRAGCSRPPTTSPR